MIVQHPEEKKEGTQQLVGNVAVDKAGVRRECLSASLFLSFPRRGRRWPKAWR